MPAEPRWTSATTTTPRRDDPSFQAPPRRTGSPVLRPGLAAGFVGILILVSIVTADNHWSDRLVDTLVFGLVCGLAVILAAYAPPVSFILRISVALAAAALVFVAILVGDPLLLYVEYYFLFLLPIIGAVSVLGTGRYRLTASQAVGATLVTIAVWRPLYASFPDLTEVFTAGGVLRPFTFLELNAIVIRKLLHETFFMVAGMLLIAQRFPYLQVRPRWPQDLAHAFGRFQSGIRRTAWLDLGLGSTAFLLAIGGSLAIYYLASLFEVPEGASESRLWENMTPLLVILLSLAAAIGEELIFRSALQPWLEQGWRRLIPGQTFIPAAFAIVIQAVLFAIVHSGYGNILHLLQPLGFGLLMGLVFRYWGILAAIYAHFAIDVLAFGIEVLERHAWFDWPLTGFLLANLAIGIVVPIYLTLEHFARKQAGRPAETEPL